LKIGAILSYFVIKRVSYVEKLPILWSTEDILEILGSAKFFSPILWSASLKSLGNTAPGGREGLQGGRQFFWIDRKKYIFRDFCRSEFKFG
jgi:hypothetical protein